MFTVKLESVRRLYAHYRSRRSSVHPAQRFQRRCCQAVRTGQRRHSRAGPGRPDRCNQSVSVFQRRAFRRIDASPPDKTKCQRVSSSLAGILAFGSFYLGRRASSRSFFRHFPSPRADGPTGMKNFPNASLAVFLYDSGNEVAGAIEYPTSKEDICWSSGPDCRAEPKPEKA